MIEQTEKLLVPDDDDGDDDDSSNSDRGSTNGLISFVIATPLHYKWRVSETMEVIWASSIGVTGNYKSIYKHLNMN